MTRNKCQNDLLQSSTPAVKSSAASTDALPLTLRTSPTNVNAVTTSLISSTPASGAAVAKTNATAFASTSANFRVTPSSLASSYQSRVNRGAELVYEDEKEWSNLERLRSSMDFSLESKLSYYITPPTEEVTIDEFIKSGDDRLVVLNHMYQAEKRRILLKVRAKQQRTNVSYQLSSLDSSCSMILARHSMNNAHWDRLSHFVLRLAFCQNEEKRRWFLQHETSLFEFRLRQILLQMEKNCCLSEHLHTDTRMTLKLNQFLINNNVPYSYVSESDFVFWKDQSYKQTIHFTSSLIWDFLFSYLHTNLPLRLLFYALADDVLVTFYSMWLFTCYDLMDCGGSVQ
jgi:hypothetical protein